tara:strand:+ start:153 stop:515 length:363 start_codon:yes stop_codon:yes gene_type:complete
MALHSNITVKAKFLVKGSGEALHEGDYHVKLYDDDIFNDDFLGDSGLDENGEASVTFNMKDIQSGDSPLEKYPDLYFVLFKGKDVIYRSNVLQDLKIEELASFSFESGKEYDLGTFLIEA